MLTKTEAVVLKTMKYGDTSKIATFYSRQFGKLKGIAKGARRSGNKFGSALEPLGHVALVLYKKEHRDLHLLSQCDSIQSFGGIQEDLEKMSVGFSVLEIVERLAREEEENAELFTLLIQTLSALDETSGDVHSLRRAFQIRIAAMLGYAPSLDVCARCGKSLVESEQPSTVGFQLMNGAVLCSTCNAAGSRGTLAGYNALSPPALQILRRFLSAGIESIASLKYDGQVGNELDETLRLYLRYHFDQMKDLQSIRIFRSVTQEHIPR